MVIHGCHPPVTPKFGYCLTDTSKIRTPFLASSKVDATLTNRERVSPRELSHLDGRRAPSGAICAQLSAISCCPSLPVPARQQDHRKPRSTPQLTYLYSRSCRATAQHIHAIAKDPVLRIRAAANTFLIFLLVIEAALVLIPQETTVLATEICSCAALILASFGWARAKRHRIGRTFSKRGLLHPLLFLIGMAGGLTLLFRSGGGMYIVTAQFLAALCFVMFNAWSLLIAASEEEQST